MITYQTCTEPTDQPTEPTADSQHSCKRCPPHPDGVHVSAGFRRTCCSIHGAIFARISNSPRAGSTILTKTRWTLTQSTGKAPGALKSLLIDDLFIHLLTLLKDNFLIKSKGATTVYLRSDDRPESSSASASSGVSSSPLATPTAAWRRSSGSTQPAAEDSSSTTRRRGPTVCRSNGEASPPQRVTAVATRHCPLAWPPSPASSS